MAGPNAEQLDTVFQTIGILDAQTRATIIEREGFLSLEDLATLVNDKDVDEMAKRMAARTLAGGRVDLGTIVIQKLKTLVWWVDDQMKRGITPLAADFTVEVMNQAAIDKRLRKELAEREPTTKDLGKFDPDDFDTYEDAFINLLKQKYGVLKEPLAYVVRPEEVPEEFETAEERRMFQLPLEGNAFELDNLTVYRELKTFLINSPGWAWIESFDKSEDGRAAFQAWTDHYNGEGELSKRTAMAKAKLEQIHYKNERILSFEKVTEIMTKCFNTLHKDVDQRYSDRQKVEKLLKAIQCQDAELIASKSVIDQQFPRNFVGACSFFSTQVARVHGPAQLEYKNARNRKRGIYAVDSRSQRGGRGRGRYGGRGRGGRGRQGGRGDQATTINGIDISNPSRSFTRQEWEALGDGRNIVRQLRERNQSTGRGRGPSGRGGGSRSNNNTERSVAAVETDDTNTAANSSLTTSEHIDCGGRHGRGFGRGAYGGSRA
jgi:hypothetical protein